MVEGNDDLCILAVVRLAVVGCPVISLRYGQLAIVARVSLGLGKQRTLSLVF